VREHRLASADHDFAAWGQFGKFSDDLNSPFVSEQVYSFLFCLPVLTMQAPQIAYLVDGKEEESWTIHVSTLRVENYSLMLIPRKP
jgi:hypothetical protein